MIPLRDNIPSTRPPYVNYALIGINVLIFLWEKSYGPHLQEIIQFLGFVPGRFLSLLGQGSVTLAVVPIFTSHSRIPLGGASGAIAGVMGAYFSLFPGARVLTLVPIFIIFTVIELPAYLFLGFWFVLQFFQGAFSVVGSTRGGGVAWWAHVGGARR